MKTSNSGLVIGIGGFLLGVVVGGIGVSLVGKNEVVAESEIESVQRVALESAQNERPLSGAEVETSVVEARDAEGNSEGGKNEVLEAMMDFGAERGRVKVEGLIERLELNESQARRVREAYVGRSQRQQAARLRMMQGKATVAELTASDGDYFIDFDASVEAVLTPEQREEFAAFKDDREGKRIARKADEEVRGLADVANLTAEQRSAAWELFAEINAAEPPEAVPEGTTFEDFEGFLDEALANRMNRLAPILEKEQQNIYEAQLDGFREIMTRLIAAGTAGSQ